MYTEDYRIMLLLVLLSSMDVQYIISMLALVVCMWCFATCVDDFHQRHSFLPAAFLFLLRCCIALRGVTD